MKTKFKHKEVVWLMHANKPCKSPICEIRIKQTVEYYFYTEDFSEGDLNRTYSPFPVSENEIFETKEELLNSL